MLSDLLAVTKQEFLYLQLNSTWHGWQYPLQGTLVQQALQGCESGFAG
jgi:hypothetical protein